MRSLHVAVRTAVIVTLLAAALLWLAMPGPTVAVRVRWSEGLSSAARLDLERRFSLIEGHPTEGTTWAYSLADVSSDNVRALVQHPNVEDTQGLQRERFRPDNAPPGRLARIAPTALGAGVGAVLLLGAWTRVRRIRIPVRSIVPIAIIVAVVTLTYLPVLTSGDKVMFNDDFFQYASRHEAVAQSVYRYHTLPLRSHWLGGGFHTITDPEDPTLNPLVLFSVLLGAANGIKAIGYLAMLIGGLATYVFARRILRYTVWGALFSALVFGTCLFVPSRIAGGNPNEVYGAWLPLCLLLLGLSLERRRWPLILLSIIFYTMVSDGKLTALMAMFYIGVLCLVGILPSLRVFSNVGADLQVGPADRQIRKLDYRPLTYLLVAVALTAAIGLPRLLPALEVIQSRGGIATMVVAHPQTYSAEGVNAYSFDELWKGILGWGRGLEPETLNRDLVTVGMLPVVLSAIALLVFWRQTLAWGIVLLLFCWLILAHHAPIDLLAPLWNLPVFNAIYRPYKYFSFQIAFTLAIVAGQSFGLLRQLHSRRVEGLIATVLILFGVGFLYPRSVSLLSNAFTQTPPAVIEEKDFFNVAARDMGSERPLGAAPYFNVLRNVGTLSGFTPVPVPTHVAPKYFVSANNQYIANPDYRGEAYFLESGRARMAGPPAFEPNAIAVPVEITKPTTVIINQNYHRDWHSNRGTLSDHGGLIALHLTEPGSYTVRLTYRPWSFYAGVALTLLAVLTLMVVRWPPPPFGSVGS